MTLHAWRKSRGFFNMGYYFEDHLSMAGALAGRRGTEKTLETIARRYVGTNPAHPLTYRPFARGGIVRGKDYRYHADFSKIFPKARVGQYVYAWARYWSNGPEELKADVNCFGPMMVWLNGQAVFKSDIFSERYPDQRHRVSLPMVAGWNDVVLRFQKTRAGFGGIFGTWLGKHPYYFLMPPRLRPLQPRKMVHPFRRLHRKAGCIPNRWMRNSQRFPGRQRLELARYSGCPSRCGSPENSKRASLPGYLARSPAPMPRHGPPRASIDRERQLICSRVPAPEPSRYSLTGSRFLSGNHRGGSCSQSKSALVCTKSSCCAIARRGGALLRGVLNWPSNPRTRPK